MRMVILKSYRLCYTDFRFFDFFFCPLFHGRAARCRRMAWASYDKDTKVQNNHNQHTSDQTSDQQPTKLETPYFIKEIYHNPPYEKLIDVLTYVWPALEWGPVEIELDFCCFEEDDEPTSSVPPEITAATIKHLEDKFKWFKPKAIRETT